MSKKRKGAAKAKKKIADMRKKQRIKAMTKGGMSKRIGRIHKKKKKKTRKSSNGTIKQG